MDFDSKDSVVREKFKPVFWIVPLVLSVLFLFLFLILKFTEKVLNDFMSWGWVFGSFFIFGLVCFGVSVVVYLLVSLRDGGVGERKFNSRERCDFLIREEMKRRTGYRLEDFSETGHSSEGVKWFGVGGEVLGYFHLYRINNHALRRYFFCMMNSQVGCEDALIVVQSPVNFDDLEKLILESGNKLCKNPTLSVSRETIYRDEVSGRSRVEKENSPLDKPDNGVEFTEVQRN